MKRTRNKEERCRGNKKERKKTENVDTEKTNRQTENVDTEKTDKQNMQMQRKPSRAKGK